MRTVLNYNQMRALGCWELRHPNKKRERAGDDRAAVDFVSTPAMRHERAHPVGIELGVVEVDLEPAKLSVEVGPHAAKAMLLPTRLFLISRRDDVKLCHGGLLVGWRLRPYGVPPVFLCL